MTMLQKMRKSRDLKAIDVCCATKLHPTTISAIENRRCVPGRDARAKLCGFFGVSEADMFDQNGLAR
jgi:transcriptional regulator with XRE-family HTH domain